MLHKINSQNTYRNLVQKCEFKNLANKLLLLKLKTTKVTKYISNKKSKFASMSRGITRIRNMCYLSSRARGTYRNFRLSRMFIRELTNAGFFIGIRKSSW